MTLHNFFLTIVSPLGDAQPGREFRRYPLRDLAAWYAEALCFVSARRPDLFTDYVVMKLGTGPLQNACKCGCQNVIEVINQVDADGNILATLNSTNTTPAKSGKWFRPVCKTSSSSDVVLFTATIDPGVNGAFTVSPPVPPGADVWVTVKCVKSPCGLTEADVLGGATTGDCKFLPAIRSYIMYRALQGDRNATGASAESQAELKAVYAYLKLQWDAEKEHES